MAAGGQTDKTADAQPTARKTTKKRAQEYGPFGDYQFVTTPTGEFGVPHGQVLSFGSISVMDKDTGQMVKRLVPEYRQANDKEMKKANEELKNLVAALDEEDDE
jgi:hypothetical protein